MVVKDFSALARKYYTKKNFPKALLYLHKANHSDPRNTIILQAMANCYLQLGDFDNAITTIRRILKIDSKNDKLYYHLSHVYFRTGDVQRTIEACEQALEINPSELNYYLHIADLYEKTNQNPKALDILCRGLHQFPNNVSLQIMTAKSERRLGKNEESLERLKNLSDRETSLSPPWKIEYNFELGFIHDMNKSADLAFHHFTKANDVIRAQPSFQKVDANHSLNLIHNLGKLDYGKINKIIEISRINPPPTQPVFFVGFPRSGTTLLQKVLDSHHGINVIEEHNPLGRVTSLIESDPVKYLQSPFLLNEKNIQELRNIYYKGAKEHTAIDDGSLLVDKLPMNIVQVHIIKILFPDAKILLGLRHPCDAILSCFMQTFTVSWASLG